MTEREILRKRSVRSLRRKPELHPVTSYASRLRSNAIRKLQPHPGPVRHTGNDFLSGVNSELRTPLHDILGLTAVLQNDLYGPTTPLQQEALKQIQARGQHLLSTINVMLDLSRIEAGTIRADMAPAAIEGLCRFSIKEVEALALAKQIRISLTCINVPQLIIADVHYLKQALVQLLHNAVKFTPAGGTVSLTVLTEPQQYISLIIRDTGIGIAFEQQSRIFQPFVQLDGARRQEGLGIGLALAKGITELHGGQIMVESSPGEGSSFTIVLPWSVVAVSEAED